MKSKVLLSMAVVAFLFIQEIAAQKVNRILQNEEKRQTLYSLIINSDERYQEFMEMAKASGRMDDEAEVVVLVEEDAKEHPAVAVVYESYENQEVMEQMVVLMKELVEKDPEFQQVINERCPEMGKAMRRVE